jgi:tRNA A-37 threonylcarbamoyl transferase component Bud32
LSEAPLPPGFGRYQTLGVIGKGAIGTVYRAHDPLIGRDVAVKMIRTEALDDETRAEYLARFGVEARAAGRCSHPGIVAIFDAGESEGRPYLVMELVEGDTLQAILADPPRRAALDGVKILLDVLEALDYAHARQVMHRDIKPANIIVTPNGRAKLTDFGIARIDYGTMTQAGDMLGTPNYMAPEQAAGTDVDHRADLFAVAAILHAILAGRPPFAGKTMSDTLLRLTDPAPVDLGAIERGAFAAFAPVLRRGLAKSPAARFGTAREFIEALHQAGSADQPPDDRTLVAAPAEGRPPGHAAPGPAALDPVLVRAAEESLARQIGPMALRFVAQATRVAANAEEFLAMLAREIPDPAAAARFLRTHGGGSGATRGTQMTTGQIGTAAAARGISPAAQEAARTVLALYTGPIARVLVNRALREANSLDTLADLLTREVKPADQPAFRRKLLAALAKG